MHGKYHVPPTLEQLSREAYRFSEGDLKYANQLSILSFRLCDLCASVHHQHLTDPIAIISAAVALDSKLVSWASTLPASWTPTPVRTPGGGMGREHGAYGDRYHIYNGLIASHAWNNYRLARYTAHERIIGQLHKLPEQGILLRSECAELAGKSKTIMNEIVEDICASVPYHIGAITRPSASQVHPEGSDHPAAAGYSLTWYLFLASSSQFAPPDLKRWALMRLENIGHAMGISQALVMASKSRAGLDPWSTERWPR